MKSSKLCVRKRCKKFAQGTVNGGRVCREHGAELKDPSPAASTDSAKTAHRFPTTGPDVVAIRERLKPGTLEMDE